MDQVVDIYTVLVTEDCNIGHLALSVELFLVLPVCNHGLNKSAHVGKRLVGDLAQVSSEPPLS